MDSLAQDTLLGDRYRLARRIAVGGMGEVWRAEDTVLHRTVAVKVLKSELTQDQTFLERFRTEARITASVQHNGIANVFDYGEVAVPGDDIPTAYLVMEYVDGEPLSAQLARDGRVPAARVLEIVRQAALALSETHRVGLVHRDVKPGNLLVRRSDGAVKITDFGIARAADAVPLTQNGMVVGTAQYFSPEQAEGRVVGPPSDVYSLGVVAYECLAGRLPFVADSPVTVAMMQIRDAPPPLPPDVPGPVRGLVLRTLAKDSRQRFAHGGELAEAVRAVQEGRPVPTFRTGRPGTGRVYPGGPFPTGVGPGGVPAYAARSGAPGLGGPPPRPTPPRPTPPRPTPPPAAGPAGPAGSPEQHSLSGPPAQHGPTGAGGPGGPGGLVDHGPTGAGPAGPGPTGGGATGTGPGTGSGPAGPTPGAATGTAIGPGAGPTGGGMGQGAGQAGAGPDGTGGTSPYLPYPPWASPPSAGGGSSPWTGTPPGDPPPGGRHRRPAWIALMLLLALILAGIATVFLTERGNADDNPARSAGILSYSTTDTGTLRVR